MDEAEFEVACRVPQGGANIGRGRTLGLEEPARGAQRAHLRQARGARHAARRMAVRNAAREPPGLPGRAERQAASLEANRCIVSI